MLDEIATVRLMAQRELWEKYRSGIPLKALLPESARMVSDIDAYYAAFPEQCTVEWPALAGWLKATRHVGATREQWAVIESHMRRIAGAPAPDAHMIEALIDGWSKATLVSAMAEACLRQRRPSPEIDAAADFSQVLAKHTVARTDAGGDLLKFDAAKIKSGDELDAECFDWRIPDMRYCMGPLRRGDFVLIGGRPEIGKTSFVVSETAHMLHNRADKILWINNEEAGERIKLRYLSAILSRPGRVIAANLAQAFAAAATAKYGTWTADRIMIREAHGRSLAEIESWIVEAAPTIVVLHRLDKMEGLSGSSENDVQRIASVAYWARRIATGGRVVIGVVQANASAEGKKFVDDSQLYGSKTALQSETDAIICIGCAEKNSGTLGINIPRNKLPGGKLSDEARRHGRFVVAFDHVTGRCRSTVYPQP